MKLQRLIFENLGGFRSKVEIDFTNNFDFVYLSGTNGSGKSCVLDTVSWVLFDQTLRGFSRGEWVNDSCDNGYAKLFLLDSDFLYSIKRFRNKNTCLLEVEKTNIKIEESIKENLTKKTVPETQEFIEKEVLCTTFDIFRNSVMFGQNDILTLAEGTDKDRKQIVGDILGFESIDVCCARVRAKMAFINTTLTTLKMLLENKEASFNSLLDISEEAISKTKKEFLGLKQDLVDRDKFIEETNKLISSFFQIARLKEVKQTIRVKSQELVGVEKDIASIDPSLFDLIPEYKQTAERLQKDINSFEVGIKVASQTLISDNNQLVNLTSFKGRCPLDPSLPCTQDRTSLIAELQVKILNTEERIKVDKNAFSKTIIDLQKYSTDVKELLDLQVKYSRLLQSKKEYEELIERLIKEKESLSTSISIVVGDEVQTEELLKVQLRKIKEEREEINIKINSLSREIGGYEEKLKTKKVLEGEIVINKNEIKDNYFILQHLSFLEELLSLKGVVKNTLLERAIPFMQQEVEKYLSILLPNTVLDIATVKQGKTALKQELTFNIRDLRSGITRDFKGWSGGQKKLIALALRLGLWKVGYYYGKKKFEFLFLDEVFGALDEENREATLTFLKGLQKQLNIPVIVVDHIQDIEEEFSQIVNFTFGSKGCCIIN